MHPPSVDPALLGQFSCTDGRPTLSKSFSEKKTTAKEVWEMLSVESLLIFLSFLFLKDLFIYLQTHQVRSWDPITDGCEPPCGCWKLNSEPLEEQSVLLATEPSSFGFFEKHNYYKNMFSF